MGRKQRKRARAGDYAGARPDRVVFDEVGPVPAAGPTTLPGLPGSPAPHMSASERKLLAAEYRLEGIAHVAAFKFDGFIRSQDATRYGFPQPVRDVARERDRLIRARARAGGLEVDDRQERPGEDTTAGGLIIPAKPKRPRSRPRLFIPGKGDR